MRSTAALWLARAEHMADAGAEIVTTLEASGFEGPAARRLTEGAAALRQEVVSLAEALQALGYELRADADLVDAMNAESVTAADAPGDAAS
jgi:hypothetical protein